MRWHAQHFQKLYRLTRNAVASAAIPRSITLNALASFAFALRCVIHFCSGCPKKTIDHFWLHDESEHAEINCLQNHLYVARLGNYFVFFTDHGRIGLPLVGTLDRFLAEILRLHFLRKTRRMGAFSVLNFYSWCVLYGERNLSYFRFRYLGRADAQLMAGAVFGVVFVLQVSIYGRDDDLWGLLAMLVCIRMHPCHCARVAWLWEQPQYFQIVFCFDLLWK